MDPKLRSALMGTCAVDAKIVWIVGMGRSGSMWTYNVTRELLRACGYRVLPERVPRTQEQTLAEAPIALADGHPENRWALKVHNRISPRMHRSRFVMTRRDPRDVLVSLMHFTPCRFDKALRGTAYFTRIVDYYRSFPPKILLDLHYPDIAERPAEVVGRIAQFLGLQPTIAAVDEILVRFSKQSVLEMVRRLDEAERQESNRPSGREVVVRVDANARLMNVNTGFQSRHVSDYCDGGWRHLLSTQEQARMQRALGPWLERNGYA